jgi:xanthine dehydrogenase small subunit
MKSFYHGYKKMDRSAGEVLVEVNFPVPPQGSKIHFEKVSKRTCLDIASVNSAIRVLCQNGVIDDIQITLGGVAPIPYFLKNTCDFLNRKPLNLETVMAGISVSQEEIAPISDVRGSAGYKQLLARQLLIAHFTHLFPETLQVRDFYEAY